MGMTFTDIENKSAKRLIGIAAVLFLHLIVAYILVSITVQINLSQALKVLATTAVRGLSCLVTD